VLCAVRRAQKAESWHLGSRAWHLGSRAWDISLKLNLTSGFEGRKKLWNGVEWGERGGVEQNGAERSEAEWSGTEQGGRRRLVMHSCVGAGQKKASGSLLERRPFTCLMRVALRPCPSSCRSWCRGQRKSAAAWRRLPPLRPKSPLPPRLPWREGRTWCPAGCSP